MPELPEVETVRKGLELLIAGATITEVLCRRHSLRYPLPHGLSQSLVGVTINKLARRGKYLLFDLSNANTLLAHLGMSGKFLVKRPKDFITQKPGVDSGERTTPPPGLINQDDRNLSALSFAKHDHIIFKLLTKQSIELILVYNDPRRFGLVDLIAKGQIAGDKRLARLGPEPFDPEFNPRWLAKLSRNKEVLLKNFLLDQRTVAGLGNIYVCEALFAAGISPLRKAATLANGTGEPEKITHKLFQAIKTALRNAITAGGSSLRDYVNVTGQSGLFQYQFKVYGRRGKKCLRNGCNGVIIRIIQTNRSTFYCPQCQR